MTNQLTSRLLAVVLAAAAPLAAQSTGIEPVNPALYSVTDRLTALNTYGGFSVHQGELHYWAGTGFSGATSYDVHRLSDGGLVSSTPVTGLTMVSNGFGDPFGHLDAAANSFYVGTYAGSGSGLYRYNKTTATWSGLGVFESLYAAASHDGKVYASGLNTIWNGGTGQNNQIALYDLSGGSSHDVIIGAGGNSAGVAVDKDGNVYYANYNGGAAGLYRWTAAQIDSVTASLGQGVSGGGAGDLYLTYDDAVLLTSLPGGANGINVDEGGNVFVTVNGAASGLLMWNESLGFGDGDFYTFVATGADGFFGWFGHIEVEGDFLNGGLLYVSAGQGVAEISYLATIPEPAACALGLGAGAFAFLLLRRRRR